MLGTKHFSTLAIYCDKDYSIHNKSSQNEGFRTQCGLAASYFINIGGHFQYILHREWEGTDSQRGVAIIMWSIMQVSCWIIYLNTWKHVLLVIKVYMCTKSVNNIIVLPVKRKVQWRHSLLAPKSTKMLINSIQIINPWRSCARVTVVVLCVSVFYILPSYAFRQEVSATTAWKMQ